MVPIVPMAAAHAAAVLRIYQAGIETGDATSWTRGTHPAERAGGGTGA